MPTDCALVVTSIHHLQENEKQSEKEKAKEKETEKESVDKSASAAARARKNRRPREKRRSTGVAYMPSEVGRAVLFYPLVPECTARPPQACYTSYILPACCIVNQQKPC